MNCKKLSLTILSATFSIFFILSSLSSNISAQTQTNDHIVLITNERNQVKGTGIVTGENAILTTKEVLNDVGPIYYLTVHTRPTIPAFTANSYAEVKTTSDSNGLVVVYLNKNERGESVLPKDSTVAMLGEGTISTGTTVDLIGYLSNTTSVIPQTMSVNVTSRNDNVITLSSTHQFVPGSAIVTADKKVAALTEKAGNKALVITREDRTLINELSQVSRHRPH